MRRIMSIEPEGWPCTLAECPPGLFEYNGSIGFKSEYLNSEGNIEAFNSAGEFFWGGVSTHLERVRVVVQPVMIVKREVDGF